jgi:hypothetical protein
MEALLQRALNGSISEEEYDEGKLPFLDMGYHATGAVMLAAIEKKRGLAGVMEAMTDPRLLLAAYNDCADESTVKFRFEVSLADRISRLGVRTPR